MELTDRLSIQKAIAMRVRGLEMGEVHACTDWRLPSYMHRIQLSGPA